jgi:hypothetical protein
MIVLAAPLMALVSLGATVGEQMPPTGSSACEIHVWTARQFHTLTEGAIWNNVEDSAYSPHGKQSKERSVPIDPLSPGDQRALLETLDLPALLHEPGARVIFHDEDSQRRPSGVGQTRQTNSASPCYAELTIAKNFFNRSELADRALRTMFILDDYGDQPMPKRSFASWGSTALQIFPAKVPENESAAQNELRAAFTANATKFAGFAFAQPKAKHNSGHTPAQ